MQKNWAPPALGELSAASFCTDSCSNYISQQVFSKSFFSGEANYCYRKILTRRRPQIFREQVVLPTLNVSLSSFSKAQILLTLSLKKKKKKSK